jgi:hypothetical protein
MLALSLLATTAAGAQSVDWPDQGEYIGFFNGGGEAAGSFEGIPFTGSVTVTGGFLIEIMPDGSVSGDYELVWNGVGTALGESGSQVITETGDVVGDVGAPVLSRKVATVATTVEGFTLNQPAMPLPPSPSPLRLNHEQCGLVEGVFDSKLDAMERAFAMFGIEANQEEGFTAFRIDEITDEELKRKVLEAMDALEAIAKALVPLIVTASTDLKGAVAEAEALIDEAETILADLDDLAICGEDVDTKLFRLGLSKAVNRFVRAVLTIAVDKSDEEAVLRLGVIAARSGTLAEVFNDGEKAIDLLATEADADKDIAALRTLLSAALVFQTVDQFLRIEEMIRSLEPGS